MLPRTAPPGRARGAGRLLARVSPAVAQSLPATLGETSVGLTDVSGPPNTPLLQDVSTETLQSSKILENVNTSELAKSITEVIHKYLHIEKSSK